MAVTSIQYIESFHNFVQKREVMKRLHFRNEKAFLEKLDGKVYAVCDKNGRYLCDVIEEDYLRLIDAGVLINLDDNLDVFNNLVLDLANFKEVFTHEHHVVIFLNFLSDKYLNAQIYLDRKMLIALTRVQAHCDQLLSEDHRKIMRNLAGTTQMIQENLGESETERIAK